MASTSKVERKLAAIMFTDIVGYTEYMSKNQDAAFVLLEEKRSKFKPLVKEYNGVLVKEMGDGTLSHYPTAVDASKCSVEFQRLIKDNDKLNVRVGIHLGDTTFKDGDIFGDGVNIASRLESMSPAGGVLVSKNVYDELLSREGFEGISLGLQSLKGVGRLVEVYALKDKHLTVPNPDDFKENKVEAHSSDEVPSIAIIPFENKGADEDIFYTYGISADLISDCSNAGLIRVASLKDVEKINYNSLETTQLSSKLLVRYIAQGTLWKMGNMFQLSIELYDSQDKKVVWSDRWQEKWDNLPNIKGNLSDGLLKALDTTPKQEKKLETTNPEAYEFYLKAKHKYEKRKNIDDTEIVRGLLKKAIAIDNNLIIAKNLIGQTYNYEGEFDRAMDIFNSTLKQTEQLDDKHEMGHSLHKIGIIYHHKGDHNNALEYYERSLAIAEKLGSKDAMANNIDAIAGIYYIKGDFHKALDLVQRALSIDEELERKDAIAIRLSNIGMIHYGKSEFNIALRYYEKSIKIINELGNKSREGQTFGKIGEAYHKMGDFEKALDYFKKSFAIREKLNNKKGMGIILFSMGMTHYYKGDYAIAIDNLEQSLNIQKKIGLKEKLELQTTIYLYLAKKKIGNEYDLQIIRTLIKETKNIDFDLNFYLYQLLKEESYLENAYSEVQEILKTYNDTLKINFLKQLLPSQIIEEYNKVFS